jgi:hypothetical protein
MNTIIKDSQRPIRNITWQVQPYPPRCTDQYEAAAHEVGTALKRCVTSGSLEAK